MKKQSEKPVEGAKSLECPTKKQSHAIVDLQRYLVLHYLEQDFFSFSKLMVLLVDCSPYALLSSLK
jgi:hypothetical protein